MPLTSPPPTSMSRTGAVSHILGREQLPDTLPKKNLEPVFVRDTAPTPTTTG